jgi:hypothetical protein
VTNASEKRMAANRGFVRAEPASRSRLVALESFGLRFERVDDFNVVVEGGFQLNIAMSYWRSIDDPSCHGYLVSALDAEIKKRNPEKPVTGRDSVAANRTASLPRSTAIAESVAGPILSDARSASLLPAVTP